MQYRRTLVAACAFFVLTGSLVAGEMKAGRWEVLSNIVDAKGMKDKSAFGSEPTVTRSCMSQSFVDRENYTSPEFAMERYLRNQMKCIVDTKQGDKTAMKWQFTCTREAFTIINKMESKVSMTKLNQLGTEITSREGKVIQETTVAVRGRYISERCETDDLELQ